MNNFNELRNILKNYRELKARVNDIEFDIEDLNKDENIGLPGNGMSEKTSRTYKYTDITGNEAVNITEKIKQLREEKKMKERLIKRIDNAMTILDGKEYDVIEMRYLRGMYWSPILYKLDMSYRNAKYLEHEAFKKLEPFLIKTAA